MAPRVLDFRDHSRSLEHNRYVYAVVSRRARGLSIGVNLNPDKVCNFDCPYCQVDRTSPGGPSAIDLGVLETELDGLLGVAASGDLWSRAPFDTVAPPLRRVADIAFSGDGEPTTPPEFPAAAALAREVRDRHGFDFPLRLLTNATLFHKPRVRAALARFDELWCKLDAGTEPYFRLVDGTSLPFRRILDNLLAVARERPIVIQSMFLRYAGADPTAEEIAAYLERLEEIRTAGGELAAVQIYTVARRPADPRIAPLPTPELERIAERVRALGIPAAAHGDTGNPQQPANN